MKTAKPLTDKGAIDGTLTIALHVVRPIGDNSGRVSRVTLYRRNYLTLSEASAEAGKWATMNNGLRDVDGLTFTWQPDPVEVTPDFWAPAVARHTAA